MKKIKTTVLLFLALSIPILASNPIQQKKSTASQTTATSYDFSSLRKVHPWTNARVAFLGDSQTDPRNSGSKIKYWQLLQQYLNITPYVYAVSGREWNDIPRQAELLNKEHGNDVDAILVLIGTNDYNHGIKIGDWYKETTEQVEAATGEMKQLYTRKRRLPDMNKDTFRGRINIAITKLKNLYPDKQIILLTPIHRALFDANDHNLQPDESYQNKAGIYHGDYAQSVKEAADIWGIPVIDMGAACGINPMVTGQQIYLHNSKDLLHPNNEGHKRMSLTLLYQLMSWPCRF